MSKGKITDVFTFDQVKELMKMHEDTILKVVDSHVVRLERKFDELKEENYDLKKHNETLPL